MPPLSASWIASVMQSSTCRSEPRMTAASQRNSSASRIKVSSIVLGEVSAMERRWTSFRRVPLQTIALTNAIKRGPGATTRKANRVSGYSGFLETHLPVLMILHSSNMIVVRIRCSVNRCEPARTNKSLDRRNRAHCPGAGHLGH
jgi:hypothetical protein